MEPSQIPASDSVPASGSFPSPRDSLHALGSRGIAAYYLADALSGALIVAMLIFGPWAFGTTQPWAIQCMNGTAYAAGLLLLFKLVIRHARLYHPPRWDNYSPRSGTFSRHQPAAVRRLNQILAWLTVAILAECLVSAWNAAATYTPATRVFHYKHPIEWLPHSFDAARTWSCFWQYLGLAAVFWSLSDWLGGVNPAEVSRLARQTPRHVRPSARLHTLIWVLGINGALLGIESIIQRESGTYRLLFLLEPRLNHDGTTEFGPYVYRSNAAQYFNLLWPLCLGLWWTLQCNANGRNQKHHWLLPCAAIMAACPIISTSRGGALISVGMLLLGMIYLSLVLPRSSAISSPVMANPPPSTKASAISSQSDHSAMFKTALLASLDQSACASPKAASQARLRNRKPAFLLVAFVTTTLALGWFFGWKSLEPRMEQIDEGYEGRDAMRKSAEPMSGDYPLFGTGPGTFATVFQLYRYSEGVHWEEQVYDDWLEIRITFGWLGFGIMLAALAVTALRGFFPGGLRGLRPLVFFAWMALGGCLLHARFDIPFQIHSILLLFLAICAILLNLGRASGASGR